MKKNQILSLVTIGLSGILYFVYNLINLIESKDYNLWDNLGVLLYTILLVTALAYAIIERKLFAGLVVTMLKITLPFGHRFLNPIVTTGKYDVSGAVGVFYVLFAILAIVSIVALILEANETRFVSSKYEFKTFLGPLLVFIFLFLFNDPSVAIIAAMAEIISLLLMAVITEDFLFLSFFITVPFKFVQKRVNGVDVTAFEVIYLVLGVELFIYGVYALITQIKHASHEEHGVVH